VRPSSRQRLFSAIVAALVFASFALMDDAYAAESNYPTKPVRVVIPFAPGGGVDVVGRLVAAKLTDGLRQQFVADNRSGAGGTVGTDIVAKAPADGYTLLTVNSGFVYSPWLYPKLPYDTVKDLTGISLIGATPSVLVVNNAVAAKSVKELLALMKAKPGQINYGASVGGTLHLAVALFEDMTGVKGTLIPYKGGGPALIDTVGGQVQMMIAPMTSALVHVKANRLRALGASGARRSVMLPELPTIAEAGVPGYEYSTWYGMLAPVATPQPIIAKLNQSMVKALESADLRDKLMQQGLEVESSTPDQFSAKLKQEVGRWGKIIKAAKIQGE
jgi:tripartite-type tricarboxylate transporter receptor subunit TctC